MRLGECGAAPSPGDIPPSQVVDPPGEPAAPGEPAVAAIESTAAPGPSSLGIWAFALAMVGFIGLLPIVGSVLGFVLGRVALRQSARRPLRGGRGLALAAVIIGLVTLIAIVVATASYALLVAYGTV